MSSKKTETERSSRITPRLRVAMEEVAEVFEHFAGAVDNTEVAALLTLAAIQRASTEDLLDALPLAGRGL